MFASQIGWLIFTKIFANLQIKTFHKLLNELFNVNLTWIYLVEDYVSR